MKFGLILKGFSIVRRRSHGVVRPACYSIMSSYPLFISIIIIAAIIPSTSFSQETNQKKVVERQISEEPRLTKQQCVTLNRGSTITIGSKKDRADNVIAKNPEKIFRPMTKKEIKLLLTALRPIKIKNNKGFKISSKPGKLSKERIQVLTQDVIATLARIHLSETLQRINNMPNPDMKTITWGKEISQVMDICALERYQGFEIDPAVLLADVTQLVTEMRTELEEVVLGNIIPEDLRVTDPLPPGIDP